MGEFSMGEARRRLDELVEGALCGGDVIIRRGDGKAVRLVPARIEQRSAPKRTFGVLRDKVKVDGRFDESLPEDELDQWEGDVPEDS